MMVMRIGSTVLGLLKRAYSFLRRHWILSVAGSIVLLLAVVGGAILFAPDKPEYITQEAIRGDLQQVVEAVGEVISERDLKLQFPITGIIDDVLVKEGDSVKAGDILARLRTSGLAAEVDAAAAYVASARAELDELEQGTRLEDIAVAEAEVANKRASLESAKATLASAEKVIGTSRQKLDSLKSEAEVSLAGTVSTANSEVSTYVTKTLTDVSAVSDIFGYTDVQEIAVLTNNGEYQQIVLQERKAEDELLKALSQGDSSNDYEQTLSHLEFARGVIANASSVVSQAYLFLSSLTTTNALTTSEKETYKGTLETSNNNIQSSLNSLNTSAKTLRDASANFDTQITAEEANLSATENTRDEAEANIRTYETSLGIAEAQLALKEAGTRQTDIDAARARLNQTYADLRRARERYEDTIITAPINGKITKVNLKSGELLSTAFASDAAITMLGDAPYRVEMFIAEIDIPKAALGQSGSIALDAFPGQPFELVVTELDPAATEVDGVPKYRAKLDFVAQGDHLKIGMTGDVEIYTNERLDVVIIPGRAVLTSSEGKKVVRILGADSMINEHEVEIGMDGEGGDVEVISGVEEGETVIVLIKE